MFNAGVCRYQGRYVMIFRNDYGDFQSIGTFEGTNLGIAFSNDGVAVIDDFEESELLSLSVPDNRNMVLLP